MFPKRTQGQDSSQSNQETPKQPKTGPRQLQDGPNTAQDRTRQPKTGPAQPNTGPRQAKTGSLLKPKTLKNNLFFKVFGISGISNANPRPRQPPDRSRREETTPDSLQTAQDLPKTAPDRPKTGPSHVKTTQDRPKTNQDRLNFEGQNLKKTCVFQVFGISSVSKENSRPR